jgi:hypothetical protein
MSYQTIISANGEVLQSFSGISDEALEVPQLADFLRYQVLQMRAAHEMVRLVCDEKIFIVGFLSDGAECLE